MRNLRVFLDERQVGTLHEGDDIWRFEYTEQWAQDPLGFDLSPALPRTQLLHADGSTLRPVQWYFDNLLPEELLREAVSKEAGIMGDDAFALLEYLGAESAGSLTLLPPDKSPSTTGGLQPLPYEQLSQRIGQIPQQTLAKGAPKRMSLAGAQHKLLVVQRGQALYEPVGALPSTHILKPNHPLVGSYPASVLNEFLTMKLADAAGLEVPRVWMHYVPQPVYVIERFDRQATWPKKAEALLGDVTPGVQRLHIIDACQLLNRARTFKTTGATLESLAAVIERTANRVQSRVQLFRWLVFNILIGNDDCHLKNLSFFMTPAGATMAPHYDLLATSAYHTKAFADELATWAKVTMAIAIPGASAFEEVTHDKLLAAGAVLGLPPALAKRIVKEVVTRVTPAFDKLMEQTLQLHATLGPEFAAELGSQVRLMKVVKHIILQTMVPKLT